MKIQQLVLRKVACFDHLRIDFMEGRDPKKADIHLIVGANGTGKSTILMALAQFFDHHHLTGLEKRFVNGDGMAVLKTNGQGVHAITPAYPDLPFVEIEGQQIKRVDMTWGRGGLFGNMFNPGRDKLHHYTTNQTLYEFSSASHFSADDSRVRDYAFSFAAFGYSGLRSTQKYGLKAIQELDATPLKDALTFSKPSASQELIQWIANTKAKEAFARNRGDLEKAEQKKEAVARIERIVSDIIDQPFSFVLNEDPLGVLVEVDGQPLDMELLPDGLKSILSWVADLLMRLDRTPWQGDVPLLERPFLLFLDEIEVHLHPAWQRKVLPVVQDLFPNAQVFVSTHSPFVIASADDAWIYPLVRKGPFSVLSDPMPSMKGNSHATILRDALGIDAVFSPQVEVLLDRFYSARDKALGGSSSALAEMDTLQGELATYGEEVLAVVVPEMRETRRRLESDKRVDVP